MMIYLVRHGETTWNREQVFRGRKDPPLSVEGERQAALVSRFFSTHEVGKVYSSPLLRASRTANAIATACGCRAICRHGLTDLDFGEWEGKNLAWVTEHDETRYTSYRHSPGLCTIPGGESFKSCYDRVNRTFIEITSNYKAESRNIVVVSHRVVLKLILIGILGMQFDAFWKIRIDTCSISEVEKKKEGFVVRGLNARCHLTDSAAPSIDF